MTETLNRFWQARDELEYARQIFNMAEPAYIDSAIFSLNAAEAKFKQILFELRLNLEKEPEDENRSKIINMNRINKIVQDILNG